MKLYFRVILMLLSAFFSKKRFDLNESFSCKFRVWPTDLNIRMHMTNSRYMSFLDIVRFEGAARAGALKIALKRKWVPMLSKTFIRVRRELNLGERFQVSAKLIYISAGWMYFEYQFAKDGFVHCQAIEKVGFYIRGKGTADVNTFMNEVGQQVNLSSPPEYLKKLFVLEEELSSMGDTQ